MKTSQLSSPCCTSKLTLRSLHERYPLLPFALDAVLVGLAYYGAYLVRWDPSELS